MQSRANAPARWASVCGILTAVLAAATLHADPVVAPRVHALGVDAPTAAAFELLLTQEIERLGTPPLTRAAETAARARPCKDAACAARRARAAGAPEALLCTLSRFGARHVATLQRVDVNEHVTWSVRLASPSANALDSLAVELAARLAGRKPEHDGMRNAKTAETENAWSGSGPSVGVVYPMGGSYGGAERLTSLAYTWRYRTQHFEVESTPVLGIAWGGDLETDGGKARDWTLLDVYVTWTPMEGAIVPYVGAGLGMHALRLEHDGGLGDPFVGRRDESSTAIGLALGGGATFFRTYDFQLGFDVRYRYYFAGFDEVGGRGAHGIILSFGLHR